LEALAGSAGNGRLRDALGWQEETEWRVQEELIGDETIEAGRGRGGSVFLASGPRRPAPAVRPEVVAATRLGRSGDKVVEQFSRFARPLLARMSSSERESRALAGSMAISIASHQGRLGDRLGILHAHSLETSFGGSASRDCAQKRSRAATF